MSSSLPSTSRQHAQAGLVAGSHPAAPGKAPTKGKTGPAPGPPAKPTTPEEQARVNAQIAAAQGDARHRARRPPARRDPGRVPPPQGRREPQPTGQRPPEPPKPAVQPPRRKRIGLAAAIEDPNLSRVADELAAKGPDLAAQHHPAGRTDHATVGLPPDPSGP